MAWMGITMDNTYYHVRVVYNTLFREFELLEGPAEGYMQNYRHERDLIGTGISYDMLIQPDPDHLDDYDSFFEELCNPLMPYHNITMPYGNSTITFGAEITGGRDVYDGMLSGRRRWKNLTVRFKWHYPQIEV